MSKKTWLLAASGLVAVAMYSPVLAGSAMAQTADASTTASATATDKKTDTTKAAPADSVVVVVRGIRGSAKDSADKKRKNKQISDSVSAEDAGKLPDNDVPDALAHLSGIQISREHGEGQDITIRGLASVGTTINGQGASGGILRSMNHNDEDGGTPDGELGAPGGSQGPTLADIPADLIKSVTVYKTSTPDQIEGGLGGTVDVQLRRPLDFAKGLTVAGSYRNVFSSIGNTQSPYASLLINDRFDTPVGEMGVLLNVGYSQNRYEEQHILNESPMAFYGATQTSLPTADQTNAVTVYRAWDGVQKGTISSPSMNFGFQWRPSDDLVLLAEGTFFGSHELSENDYLELRTAGDGSPTVSNLVYAPDGKTVKSMTLTTPAGSVFPLYVDSQLNDVRTNSYHTNFEADYDKDRWHIKASAQYNWSQVSTYYFYQQDFLQGLTSANIDLDSSGVPGGGPIITTPGYDLSNASNYSMFDFHDGIDKSKSNEFDAQLDVTYDISDTSFFRSVQSGLRFTNRRTNEYNAYRDAFPGSYLGEPLSTFPTGNNLVSSNLDISGFNSPTWYHLSDTALAADMAAVRSYIVANSCEGTNPPATCIETTRYDWSTTKPSDLDKTGSFDDHEFSVAYYGQLNYGFHAFYPIDGVAGARIVQTSGGSSSTQVGYSVTSNYVPTYTTVVGRGKYTDIMPSLNATIHFTPKLQLRLDYTYNVERPTFAQLSPDIVADAIARVAYAGNPNLQPNKITNYDTSLEYYFGHGGMVSFAAYLKKPNASFFYSEEPGIVPQIDPNNAVPVYTVRNAGPGTYQGYEFNAQGFFDFLPGFWKNFGGAFNYSYNQVFKIDYPVDAVGASFSGSSNAPYTSKDTYNIQLYYDTPKLSARIAYNYRSKFAGDPYLNEPDYTQVTKPTSRLDAAINWSPQKNVTFSLEGSNLLKNNLYTYWGTPNLPAEVRLQAQTITLGVRFRN